MTCRDIEIEDKIIWYYSNNEVYNVKSGHNVWPSVSMRWLKLVT